MNILDNNVISELWKPQPNQAVLEWLENNEWFLPAPVLAEIQEGAEALQSAARRAELNAKIDEIVSDYSEALLDWDAETARTWGRLRHSPEVKRRPQPLWDSLLDALAVRHSAIVVTRNRQEFRPATTFDPWTGVEHRPRA